MIHKLSRLLMTLVALFAMTAGAWADWNGETYTATANENLGAITVNADATLTINEGVTVTVTGGINVASGTLTIVGPGTLEVTGTKGNNGGDGSEAAEPGGDGGVAISGNIIVQGGATVTATGGTGGNGGNSDWGGYGGNGGNGGNAFAGTLTYKSGTVTANGGSGGSGGSGDPGGSSGSAGKAFANEVDFTQTTGYSVTDGSSTITTISNQKTVVISGGTEPEPPIEVTWNAAAKQATFDMPASDVVLTPLYAPVAQWATESEVELLPTAAEGIFAGTTDPLIVEGTVAPGQGTVMYAVTSTNQATAPALSAFSATVPTAENIADEGADVLVWYYIQGADTPDGQEATAENTFNDSEICAMPLEVSVLSNQFDITLNAANANTIESGKGTVTVKTGDAEAVDKTADIDADHQLKAVKMGSTVTINAKQGYKFRKVEAKKVAPTLDLATVTTATTVEDGYTLTGTLGASVKISIADGATVTLDGMTINGANDPSCKWAGITCLGDATIILSGTNTVKGFYDEYPGIYVPQNKTLTIQGSGSLTASSNGMGCGIGGGFQIACGNIVIAGGTITATGGNNSAGIGGGYSGGSCGTISITGGTVTANGGQDGAGIGSGSEGGSCGNISITGGTINATGVKYGAGIGSGSDGSCGTVTITNGVTSLTATKGGYAPYSIGPGDSGSCGTVTIGCSLDSNGNIISGTGSTGSITTSPYTYQPSN